MVRRKKIVLFLVFPLVLLILLLWTFLSIEKNLHAYSIYYAQHVPHRTGTDPVMCAVIDNLDNIYIPELNKKSHVAVSYTHLMQKANFVTIMEEEK